MSKPNETNRLLTEPSDLLAVGSSLAASAGAAMAAATARRVAQH